MIDNSRIYIKLHLVLNGKCVSSILLLCLLCGEHDFYFLVSILRAKDEIRI